MAVKGLDKFKEYSSKDNYVIIGDTACSVIMRNADMKPRATKDIDMILIVEQMTPEFASDTKEILYFRFKNFQKNNNSYPDNPLQLTYYFYQWRF